MVEQLEDLGKVVPTFGGAHNRFNEYEFLTYVYDEDTLAAYLSKTCVPKGVEITNRDYWQPMGAGLYVDGAVFEYKNFKKKMVEDMDRLTFLVKSFLKSSPYGAALDNKFGNEEYIGVNQKVITAAINKIWDKLEDMTGEALQGIDMTVTPDYFISEDGADVHITANTVEANGIFEHISFYGNGELITEADNVNYFEFDTHFTETTVVKCVAQIMGIEYERQHIVTHYNSFWLGAGNTYSDIMNVNNVIPITKGMRGAYDVIVGNNQHIIVVVGDSLAKGFLRADMNGFEIPFTESRVTLDGISYKVFISENVYNAGKYNIDING